MYIKISPLGVGDEDEGKAGKRRGSGSNAALDWAELGLALVLTAMVSLVFITGVLLYTSTWDKRASTQDGACQSPDQCMVAFRHPGTETCAVLPASTHVKCNSNCYLPGYDVHPRCNGNGSCVGDNPLACKGWCPYEETSGAMYVTGAPSCTSALFPLKPYFNVSVGSNELNRNIIHTQGVRCVAQRCTLSVLQVFADTYGDSSMIPSQGQIWPCSYMLDTTSTTVDTSCIASHEVWVDSQTVSTYINLNVATFDDSGWVGATGRMCVFYYACAAHGNRTTFSDPTNLAD
jgi:hypothetical protein